MNVSDKQLLNVLTYPDQVDVLFCVCVEYYVRRFLKLFKVSIPCTCLNILSKTNWLQERLQRICSHLQITIVIWVDLSCNELMVHPSFLQVWQKNETVVCTTYSTRSNLQLYTQTYNYIPGSVFLPLFNNRNADHFILC